MWRILEHFKIQKKGDKNPLESSIQITKPWNHQSKQLKKAETENQNRSINNRMGGEMRVSRSVDAIFQIFSVFFFLFFQVLKTKREHDREKTAISTISHNKSRTIFWSVSAFCSGYLIVEQQLSTLSAFGWRYMQRDYFTTGHNASFDTIFPLGMTGIETWYIKQKQCSIILGYSPSMVRKIDTLYLSTGIDVHTSA